MKNITLNMIVKNESHVIEETLNSIYKYINYYVISDTGSTDNTQNIIKNFFNSKNINGEIHQKEWINFGYNRTEALQLCKNKGDYIWVIDADDIIIGDIKLPELEDDCYLLKYGNGFTYYRQQIFKNESHYNWRYVGVLHEYPDCDKKNIKKTIIDGNYYLDSRRLGDRNKNPDKYLNDALILEKGLIDEPNNERYMFYLGQSYLDHAKHLKFLFDKTNDNLIFSDFENTVYKSINAYSNRISKGGWFEEVYYSYYKIGEAFELLNKPINDIEKAYLDAYNYLSSRAEPLYNIAKLYLDKNDFENSYKYSKMASKIKYPKDQLLFISKDVYEYKILDVLSISSYYTERYTESHVSCALLLTKQIPLNQRERILNNLKFAKEKIDKIKKKIYIYCNNIININGLYNLFANLNDYDINIISNTIIDTNFKIHPIEIFNLLPEPEIIIIYENLNYFFDNIKFKNSKLYLYLFDNFFVNINSFGKIIISNPDFLNSLLINVSNIITQSKLPFEFNEYTPSEIFNLDVFSNISIKKSIDTINFLNNGFLIEFPNHINLLLKDISTNNTYHNLIRQYYLHINNYIQHIPEITLEICRFYNNIRDFDNAIIWLNNTYKYINNPKFKLIVNAEEALIYFNKKEYLKSFQYMDNILKNSNIRGKIRQYLQDIRDKNIDFIKDTTLNYPQKKINNIKTNKQIKIMVTMTTCKRFDLFFKTINSFINCCKDLYLIDKWFLVDDFSNHEDREKLKKQYPFIEFYFKNNNDKKGHVYSMNIIYNKILEYNCNYILHLEDDFHFIDTREYIKDAIKIMEYDKNIGQVLFNKNYQEIEYFKKNIAGGFEKETPDGLIYVEHEHYNPSTKQYNEFVEKYKGFLTCGYYPHFSFRPSLINCSIFKNLGPFYNTHWFEHQYAIDYTKFGYKSAFFDAFTCIHIGKKTWEKDKYNAYVLNNEQQFNIIEDNINIYILTTDTYLNNWCQLKLNANKYFNKYYKQNIEFVSLNNEIFERYKDNNFNYQRNIINYLESHINLINNLKKSNNLGYIILNDDIKFIDNFEEKYKEFNKIVKEYDLIFLSENNGYMSYYISKEYANKLDIKIISQNMDFLINSNSKKTYFKLFDEQPKIFNINKSVDNYIFYNGLDSVGFDIEYIENKSIDELKLICNNNDKCLGFNSLGYLKYKINPIHLFKPIDNFNLNKSSDFGLYIKNI